MTLALNQTISSFSLPTHPQGNMRHSDLLGKWSVLYFYPKDNTPGCTQESVEFQAHIEDFQRLGAQVIGVSRDSVASHAKFAEKFSLTFPLIADTEEYLCSQFNVMKEKTLYGKTYMGIERSTFIIDPHGVLRAEWRKVSVKEHVEVVLQQLEKLQQLTT